MMGKRSQVFEYSQCPHADDENRDFDGESSCQIQRSLSELGFNSSDRIFFVFVD